MMDCVEDHKKAFQDAALRLREGKMSASDMPAEIATLQSHALRFKHEAIRENVHKDRQSLQSVLEAFDQLITAMSEQEGVKAADVRPFIHHRAALQEHMDKLNAPGERSVHAR